MTEFFNAYEQVSYLEMDELAFQIMEEFDDQSTQEELRCNMLSSMNSAKISPQTTCPQGKTLGFYLAREMSLPILLVYQSLGGNLTHQDYQGNTLLFEVCSGFPVFLGNDCDMDCIDILIQQGLDINHTNKLGQTPIFGVHCALQHSEVQRIIASEGHERDFERRYEEYIKLLKLAQSKGADLRHRCNKGFDVFDVCEQSFDTLQQHLTAYKAQMEKSALHIHIQTHALDSIVQLRTRKI